jgi:type IV pilus biogenesis protein CpaD/CtpE
MKTFRSILRPALAALACASIAACASRAPTQTDLQYRSRPAPQAQGANGAPGSSDSRLTIQSGEGERINLPWFIRDTQEWINTN